jgi:hypothetical protein
MISEEDRAGRNTLSTRYKNAQKIAAFEEQIRGIRTGINILIREEKRLQEEIRKLKPARQTEGRGGA